MNPFHAFGTLTVIPSVKKARAEKLKLVLLGSLATIAVQLVFLRLSHAPVPAAAIPCTQPVHIARRPASGGPPPPIRSLETLDRLQRVAPAGGRDLFRFIERPHHTQPPSQQSQRAAEQKSGALTTTVSKSIPQTPLVFYGYVLSRGDPLLAFVLLEDEIHLVTQGESIHGRYRLAGFRASALTMEDLLTGHVVNLPMFDTF